VLLYAGGAAGLLLSVAGALGDVDPGRERSRLIGVLLFGTTSLLSLASAWLLSRRPRIGRVLGLGASAGGLFLGWVVTQSSQQLPGVLLGVAIAGAAAVVAWQLARWPRESRGST
jgi:drug/metabolite transporter (DMT)-like permease